MQNDYIFDDYDKAVAFMKMMDVSYFRIDKVKDGFKPIVCSEIVDASGRNIALGEKLYSMSGETYMLYTVGDNKTVILESLTDHSALAEFPNLINNHLALEEYSLEAFGIISVLKYWLGSIRENKKAIILIMLKSAVEVSLLLVGIAYIMLI